MSTSDLEASVEAKLRSLGATTAQWQPTIFRVPAYISEGDRTAYEPRVVSIGPYYHGAAALCAMEDHKWRYLADLLSRQAGGSPPPTSSSTLIREVRRLEARARACYSERPEPELGSEDFVLMLLLDGCFVLEFFKWHTKQPDALSNVGWGLTLVATDLLLLENQIPFFVVESLYAIVAGAQGSRESLVSLLLEHISDEEPATTPRHSGIQIHHLLHLYYESSVPNKLRSPPPSPTVLRNNKTAAAARVIPRATEMIAAAVTFERRTSPRDTYDVSFDGKRGVMEIPYVAVDEMKRPLLVNLVAFEQTNVGGAAEEEPRVVTSYVSLMSMLVRGASDVELLRRRGVLDNLLADDDAAARFFSHLGDCAAMNYDSQVFAALYEDVRTYCGSWRHRNRPRSCATTSPAPGPSSPSSTPPSCLLSRRRRPSSQCFQCENNETVISILFQCKSLQSSA